METINLELKIRLEVAKKKKKKRRVFEAHQNVFSNCIDESFSLFDIKEKIKLKGLYYLSYNLY